VPADALQFLQRLPANFSIVSDAEFSLLSLLPEFQQRGDCLVRTDGDTEFFVIKQSFHDRLARIEAEIDNERVDDMNAAFPEPIVPKLPPKPAIPAGDLAAAQRFNGPLPDYPSSSRPKDRLGGTIDFSPLF
jgi:hypothetical protein